MAERHPGEIAVVGNDDLADLWSFGHQFRSPRIRRPQLPGKRPACFQAQLGLSRDERTAAARYMRLHFSWPCTPRVFLGVITGIMPRKKAGVQNTRGYPDKSEHCALQSGNFFTGRVGDTQL